MTHTIEPAASGRARCRGCKQPIARDELRFGERLPNPFADGEMTLWFHLVCGAYRRPASLSEIIDAHDVPNVDRLRHIIEEGIEHHRLERLAGVERSPSGRAKCRSCREAIGKGEWRIILEFFEEGTFNPAGYIHTRCASNYFETTDIVERIEHFTTGLEDGELTDIRSEIA